MLEPDVQQRIETLLEGVQVFLVGGCVRDQVMGREPKDFDLVLVGTHPEDMLARGFSVHGIEHSVFVHRARPLRGLEFSLARREKKVGAGHTGFAFEFEGVGLEDDLRRRDLTVNAMALPLGGGAVVDPFGGQADLEARRLRHVSPAFAEDPLRVLRVARFLARFGGAQGWQVAPETAALCRQLVEAGECDALTPERVALELTKALAEPHPSDFVRFLHQVGALARVLPELDLFGIPQPPEHHPEVDTGEHLCLVLDQVVGLSDDPLVRWGALVHDVGKKLTPPESWPQHIGHETAGAPVARELARRLALSKDHEELGALVSELHLFVHRCLDMTPGGIVRNLMKLDRRGRFLENVDRLTWVAEADARGRTGLEDRPYPQGAYLRAAARAYAEVKPRPAMVEAVKAAPGPEKKAAGDRLRGAQRQDRVAAVKQVPRPQSPGAQAC